MGLIVAQPWADYYKSQTRKPAKEYVHFSNRLDLLSKGTRLKLEIKFFYKISNNAIAISNGTTLIFALTEPPGRLPK